MGVDASLDTGPPTGRHDWLASQRLNLLIRSSDPEDQSDATKSDEDPNDQ